MQDPDTTRGEKSLDAVESGVFTMLVADDEQRPCSIREIELAVGDEIAVADALASLRGNGLVHRLGEFVWATRAAVAADRVAA
jgi:hypothetical protein